MCSHTVRMLPACLPACSHSSFVEQPGLAEDCSLIVDQPLNYLEKLFCSTCGVKVEVRLSCLSYLPDLPVFLSCLPPVPVCLSSGPWLAQFSNCSIQCGSSGVACTGSTGGGRSSRRRGAGGSVDKEDRAGPGHTP